MASTVPISAFVSLPAATLATMLTDFTACMTSIATAGQEYEIGGRKFRRPDIAEVAAILSAIAYAQNVQSGRGPTRTLARFR